MKDILLISLENNTNSIGIRSISSYLKKMGHRPALLFLPIFTKPNEKTLKEIISFIKYLKPLLIGISFMSFSRRTAIELTKAIQINTEIPVIWGGVDVTMCPEESLEFTDIVCVGDGEEATAELIKNKKMGANNFSEKVKNIWLKNKKGEIIKNPISIPTENYDFFPPLDYSLEDNYILSDITKKISILSSELFYKHLVKLNTNLEEPAYLLLANRGCPFGCSFCCNGRYNEIYGKHNRLRGYSIERIINEAIYVKNNLPIFKSIWVIDLDISQNSLDWIREFSEEYHDKVSIPFGVAMNLDNICHEKIKLLMKAGLILIEVGIQSLSKTFCSRIFNRHLDLDKLFSFIKSSADLRKIYIIFDLTVNNPYMTMLDRIKSFVVSLMISALLVRNNIKYRFLLGNLQFFPGTRLTEMAKRDKVFENRDNEIKCYYIKNWIFAGPLFYFPIIPEKLSWAFLVFLTKMKHVLRRSKKFFSDLRYIRTT